MDVSRQIQALRPSATFAITARAAELKGEGRDVISLGAGEPDFDTPSAAREAGIAAIQSSKTHYTAVGGITELKQAICEKLARDQNLQYATNQVTVSAGAKQSLFNAVLALTDPGDRMIYPAPYWVSYPAFGHLASIQHTALPTTPETGFRLQPEVLEEALKEGARVFLFNSPSNPTGTVYHEEELQALGAVLERYETWIVTDEIYENLVFDGARHVSLPQVCPALKDRTVVINGVSKAYAMTGWRIGYGAGPENAIRAMEKVQSHTTSNPCSISQYAALEALISGSESVNSMREIFAQRRQQVLEALGKIPGVRLQPPEGAFYVFPDVSDWYTKECPGSAELCRRILESEDLALVPGEAFGDDRCVRLSYAASEADLTEALKRFASFFRRIGRVDSRGTT